MSPELSRQLDLEEARVPYAYQDKYGYWSIGCGRLIDKRKGGRLRDSEIDFLKSNDIDEEEEYLTATYPWFVGLSRCRKDALIQASFNLGKHGLSGFTGFITLMASGQWDKAADDLLTTLWAKELPGRVARIAMQIRTNTYQYPK